MSLVPTRAKETFMDLNRPSEGGLSLTKLSDSRPDACKYRLTVFLFIFATLLI